MVKDEQRPYRFMYDHTRCSYEYLDPRRLKMFSEQSPPNNCLSCALREEQDLQVSPLELKNERGVTHGMAFAGKQFHLEDFVLYRAESGPCNIGYVIDIAFSNRLTLVTVRKVGRIVQLDEKILPAKMIKDEVRIQFLIQKNKIQRFISFVM
jgi:DNA (cytosine-5)-methyltransferase 1